MILAMSMGLSFASDAITWSVERSAQFGAGDPTFHVDTWESGAVDVVVTCAGRSFALSRSFGPGVRLSLPLPGLPEGSTACRAQVQFRAANGASGEATVPFTAIVLTPLTATTSADRYRAADASLALTTNRPIAGVDCVVLGDHGRPLWSGAGSLTTATEARCAWDPAVGEALKVIATVRDESGFAFELTALPWWYAIPHDDVVFASNDATIPATQGASLERAWVEVQAVEARFQGVAPLQLFVAGYTDTVGDAGHNHVLSERRARAIAAWFRDRGFEGAIFHQGFGERVPAVPTADEVDLPANRRAIYLLSAEFPPTTPDLPTPHWKRL